MVGFVAISDGSGLEPGVVGGTCYCVNINLDTEIHVDVAIVSGLLSDVHCKLGVQYHDADNLFNYFVGVGLF